MATAQPAATASGAAALRSSRPVPASRRPDPVRGEDIWGIIINAGRRNGAQPGRPTSTATSPARGAQGYNAAESRCQHERARLVHVHTDGRDLGRGVPVHQHTDPVTTLNRRTGRGVDYLLGLRRAAGSPVFMSASLPRLLDWPGAGSRAGPPAQCDRVRHRAGRTGTRTRPNIVWITGGRLLRRPYDTQLNAWRTAHPGRRRHAPDLHREPARRPRSRTRSTRRTRLTRTLRHSRGIQLGLHLQPGYNGVSTRSRTSRPPPTTCRADPGGVRRRVLPRRRHRVRADRRRLERQNIWWALTQRRARVRYRRQTWSASGVPGRGRAGDGRDVLHRGHARRSSRRSRALPGWHKLVPELGSALVTAGRGTRATTRPPGAAGTTRTPTAT